MYDVISYSKGGRILHMLRKYVGDEAFYASLNYYLESHKFSSVEIHDLRLAFEKITGEDLNWFFNEWYLNHGKPSLKIDYAWNDSLKKETVTIAQTQNLQKNPLYKIPLLVDIYYEGKVDRKKIVIEKMKEDFSFSLSSQPDLVNVDAEKMLLCTKQDNKTKEEFIFQYYHAPLYLDRYEALMKIGDTYTVGSRDAKLVSDALNDKFWNIRNIAIKNIGALAKEDKQRVQQKLIAMSLVDDNSHVRAAAMKAIAKNYPNDTLAPIFENALNDSSYLVMTTAFKIICDKDVAKGLMLAKQLEGQNDINISTAVATFYAQQGNVENNDFLIATLAKAKGFDKYTLISTYEKYLAKIEDSKAIQAGIAQLVDLGRKGTSRFTRSASVKALGDLTIEFNDRIAKAQKQIEEMRTSGAAADTILIEESKLEKIKRQRDELKASVDDIKKNEKDKRLLKTYQEN